MTWDTVGMKLVELLLPVIAALLIALLSFGITWVRKQTEKLNNQLARDVILSALAEAELVGKDAIRSTNQRLVDDLKDKGKDGLTKDEATQAMDAAKQYFVGHLSNGAMSILEKALGPVNQWLEDFLEAKVAEVKGETRAKVSAIANPLSSIPVGSGS